MSKIAITVAGWVATEPRVVVTPAGSSLCSFRLASIDDEHDTTTEWFTVRVHGGAATTVHASIRKGEPVIVTGTLRTHYWNSEEGERADKLLDVTHIGHDLTKGIATFTRAATHGAPNVTPEPTAA